ncbi:PilZ domain-containing protein [Vibrio sp. ZSDE26]|uniref:PilZ domain-containing protein n=1 Tax=Vibrio amylolyticus TaxID=2847292 RepID=A0A9X1XG76_9VIBR|nr:PilZ domain-containing protein [Vibrio amylolyticus]MCK6262246.1 PilZ domain-containing protein [Vibrio amylolyticus]
MNSKNESKRKHARWYFWLPEEPFGTQTSGLAVELKKLGWFRRKLGRAVIKDISLGGAGVLISNKHKIPGKIVIVTPEGLELMADVVYQRPEGKSFTFLGLTWSDGNEDKILELISDVQEITNSKSRVETTSD